MTDHDRRADPAPQPFTAEEIASMREAAAEDRHLARVVATVDALAPQPLTDEEFKSLCSRIALSSHAAAMSDVHTLMRHARAKSAQLRAAEQRAAAAEGERDTARSHWSARAKEKWSVPPEGDIPRDQFERIISHWKLDEQHYTEWNHLLQVDLDAERSRAETAEARAGRLEALLREARDDGWLPPPEFYDDEQRPDADSLFARIDAELLATAAPQPPEQARTTRDALAELVRVSEAEGLYDREFAEAQRRKAAPQPSEEGE